MRRKRNSLTAITAAIATMFVAGWGAVPTNTAMDTASVTSMPAASVPHPIRAVLAAAQSTAVSAVPISIASGLEHTCALFGNGTVKCWGSNKYGQLGNGDTSGTFSATPVSANGVFKGATQITAGDYFTCVLTPPSTTSCWGNNGGGQLGLGDTRGQRSAGGDVYGVWSPVSNQWLIGKVLSIAAGGSHTCAVLTDHTVECWGNDYWGELGNGTTNASAIPRVIRGLTGVTSLSAWGSDTCALLIQGTVDCWGFNGDGELGPGVVGISKPVPQPVPGITGGIAIASFGGGSCALLSDHTVKCWGANDDGQLGTGTAGTAAVLSPPTGATKTTISVPQRVVGLTTATAIVGGGAHVCALLASHAVQCWGNNAAGQLGNSVVGYSAKPVTMTGITTATGISAGQAGTCVVLSTGGAMCTGADEFGELGTGVRNQPTSSPVRVIGL